MRALMPLMLKVAIFMSGAPHCFVQLSLKRGQGARGWLFEIR